MAIQRLVAGKNALIDAAGNGDIEKVKKLLQLNVSTKSKDKYGCTALHRAAENGHADVVVWLLDSMREADDVATKDFLQRTALHGAAQAGHAAVVARLLARMHEADNVATKDKYQRTALHWAAWRGHVDVVALLLGHMREADVAAKDSDGRTALDLAAGDYQGTERETEEERERERQGRREVFMQLHNWQEYDRKSDDGPR